MGPVLCPVSALFTLHPIPSFLQESMLFFWTLPTVGDEMCVHTDLENPVPAHCWQHQQCREMPAAPGWSPKNFKQPGWCPPSPPCPTAVPIQGSALGDTRARTPKLNHELETAPRQAFASHCFSTAPELCFSEQLGAVTSGTAFAHIPAV